MLPYRDSRLTSLALGIFFVVAIFYALFEARGQLLGPTITLHTPVVSPQDPLIIIEGSAARISSLVMNGKQISVTETGSFREPYLLASGYNRIVLVAKDTYGRTNEKTVALVYHPDTAALPLTASTTLP